jgi:hypothetical protein
LLEVNELGLDLVVIRFNVLITSLLDVAVGVLLLLFVDFNKLDALTFGFKFGFVELFHAELNDLNFLLVLNLHIALIFLGEIFELAFTSLEAVRELGEEASLSLFFTQVVNGILKHINCVANLSVL